MSSIVTKQVMDALKAGHLGGEALHVEAVFDEGVVVRKVSGKKDFIPSDFLRLLLLRQRGRDA
jgi:hypothetical protein